MTSPKQAEYSRRYRERHPERVKAARLKWCRAHPERRKAATLKWRQAHPERVLETRRKYTERNREKLRDSYNKWRRENPDKRKESNDRFWGNDYEKRLSYHLVRYGITIDDFNALLQKQGGHCAACGNGVSGKQRRLHVDHNHATGKVRGLLCGPCNRSIGFAEENPARLRALAGYLESHS